MRARTARNLLIIAGIAAVKVIAYRRLVHPWMDRWGATDDEVSTDLPADSLVSGVAPRVTRAVTIDAPADVVWSWLVQIGQERAGFYSYSWLENLAGARMHNADRVHPEWQRRAEGDVVRLAGPYGRRAEQVVARVEPERMLVLTSHADFDAIVAGRVADGYWGFFLRPVDAQRTRLIARGVGGSLGNPVFDVAHFVMERGMLLGIKARAEGRVRAEDHVHA